MSGNSNLDKNKATVELSTTNFEISDRFPKLPIKWEGRIDKRIWGQFKDFCTRSAKLQDASAQNYKDHYKKWLITFWVFIILSIVMFVVFLICLAFIDNSYILLIVCVVFGLPAVLSGSKTKKDHKKYVNAVIAKLRKNLDILNGKYKEKLVFNVTNVGEVDIGTCSCIWPVHTISINIEIGKRFNKVGYVDFNIKKKQSHNVALQIHTSTQQNVIVSNVFVVCIAIGSYDNERLSNLKVDTDIIHYKRVLVEKYKYELLSNIDHFSDNSLNKSKLKEFINICLKKIINYDDDNNGVRYDGIIISISGHGSTDSLICSDSEKVKYQWIRQRFSQEETLASIPRIFCVDACRENIIQEEKYNVEKRGVVTGAPYSVTLLATTEGNAVAGGKIAKYFTQNMENIYKKQKWSTFYDLCVNINNDIEKNTKNTAYPQQLIKNELDIKIDNIIFKPKQ
eukprot:298684_1